MGAAGGGFWWFFRGLARGNYFGSSIADWGIWKTCGTGILPVFSSPNYIGETPMARFSKVPILN
jgi:hypothetical protein